MNADKALYRIQIYKKCIKIRQNVLVQKDGMNASKLTLNWHVFVKHGCPRRQQSQNMAKIFKSYILTPPHPQGHGMSV